MSRLALSGRLYRFPAKSLQYMRKVPDFSVDPCSRSLGISSARARFDVRRSDRAKVVQRCILMATDPATLCSTPRAVRAQRRTSPSSGVAAGSRSTRRASRSRSPAPGSWARDIPYYLAGRFAEGLRKEAEVSGRAFADRPTHGNVRHGFVYERVPHITLKSIANNAEIDVI